MKDVIAKLWNANGSRKWLAMVLFVVLVLNRKKWGVEGEALLYVLIMVLGYIVVQGAIDLIAVLKGTKAADPGKRGPKEPEEPK